MCLKFKDKTVFSVTCKYEKMLFTLWCSTEFLFFKDFLKIYRKISWKNLKPLPVTFSSFSNSVGHIVIQYRHNPACLVSELLRIIL